MRKNLAGLVVVLTIAFQSPPPTKAWGFGDFLDDFLDSVGNIAEGAWDATKGGFDGFRSSMDATWSAVDSLGVDSLVATVVSGDLFEDVFDDITDLNVVEIGNFVADQAGGFAALALNEMAPVLEDLKRISVVVINELQNVAEFTVEVITKILSFLGCFFDRLVSGENPILCLCGLGDLDESFDAMDTVEDFLNAKLEEIIDIPTPDKFLAVVAKHLMPPDGGSCAGSTLVNVPFPSEINSIFEAFNKIPCVPDLPEVSGLTFCQPSLEVLMQELMEPVEEYKKVLVNLVTGETANEFVDLVQAAIQGSAAQQVCVGLQLRHKIPKTEFDFQVQVSFCMDLYGEKPSFFEISIVPIIQPFTLKMPRKQFSLDLVVNVQKSMRRVEKIEANLWSGMHLSMNSEADRVAAISFGSLFELSQSKTNNPEFDCDMTLHFGIVDSENIDTLKKLKLIKRLTTKWYTQIPATSPTSSIAHRSLRAERQLFGLPCIDFPDFTGLSIHPAEFTFNFPIPGFHLPLTIESITTSVASQLPGEATETVHVPIVDLPILIRTQEDNSVCLDVNKVRLSPDQDTFVYNNVQYVECAGHSQQQWLYKQSLQSIVSVDGGQCLTFVTGFVNLQTRPCNGSPSQRWKLDDSKLLHIDSGSCLQRDTSMGSCDTAARHGWRTTFFKIEHKLSSSCLNSQDGTLVAEACSSYNANSVFYLQNNGQIVRFQDATCLTIDSDGVARQKACQALPEQRFLRSPSGSIRSMTSTPKCLTARGDGLFFFDSCDTASADNQSFDFTPEATVDIPWAYYRVRGSAIFSVTNGHTCTIQDEYALKTLFGISGPFIEVDHLPSGLIYDNHCRESNMLVNTYPRDYRGVIYAMVETNKACEMPDEAVWSMYFPAQFVQVGRLTNAVTMIGVCPEKNLVAGTFQVGGEDIIITNGDGHFCHVRDEYALGLLGISQWNTVARIPSTMIRDGYCPEPEMAVGTYPRDVHGNIYKIVDKYQACHMPNEDVWSMYFPAQVTSQVERLFTGVQVVGECPEPTLPSGHFVFANTGDVIISYGNGHFCHVYDPFSMQLLGISSPQAIGRQPASMILDGSCPEPEMPVGSFPRDNGGTIFKIVAQNQACHMPNEDVWSMYFPAQVTSQVARLHLGVQVIGQCPEPALPSGTFQLANTGDIIISFGNSHYCHVQDMFSYNLLGIQGYERIARLPSPMIYDSECREPNMIVDSFPRDGNGVIYKIMSPGEACYMPDISVWGMYYPNQVTHQVDRLYNSVRVTRACPEPILPSGNFRFGNTGEIVISYGNGQYCLIQDPYSLQLLGVNQWVDIARRPAPLVYIGTCPERSPPIGAYPRVAGNVYRIINDNQACWMPNEVIWDMYYYTGGYYDVPRLPNRVGVVGNCGVPRLAAGWWRFADSGIIGYSDGNGGFCMLSSMDHYYARGAPWYKNIAYWPPTMGNAGYCPW